MTVVLICIEAYDAEGLCALPGTQTDKDRLYKLFTQKYGFKVIKNNGKRVTCNKMDDILYEAKKAFRDEDDCDDTNTIYDGIMIFIVVMEHVIIYY